MPGCRSIFDSTENLDAHIAANIHLAIEDNYRSSNDITRIQLIESIRSTTTSIQYQTAKVFQQQDIYTELHTSPNYKCFSIL